jgi:hypothetical protein
MDDACVETGPITSVSIADKNGSVETTLQAALAAATAQVLFGRAMVSRQQDRMIEIGVMLK